VLPKPTSSLRGQPHSYSQTAWRSGCCRAVNLAEAYIFTVRPATQLLADGVEEWVLSKPASSATCRWRGEVDLAEAYVFTVRPATQLLADGVEEWVLSKPASSLRGQPHSYSQTAWSGRRGGPYSCWTLD
jgi:hypothetical protein